MAGKRKSIEDLYGSIFAIRESLQDAIQLASEAALIADNFGGEISRVLTEQINTYFIPNVTKFIDDGETPGAIAPLITFLDSVPLAMTREEPAPEQTTPAPVPGATLATPPSQGSYAAETIEPQNVFESKKLKTNSKMMEAANTSAGILDETANPWSIYRVNIEKKTSTMVVANLPEAEAKKRVEILNEDLGTLDFFEYKAEKASDTKTKKVKEDLDRSNVVKVEENFEYGEYETPGSLEKDDDLTEVERIEIEELVADGWDYEDALDYIMH